MTTTTTIEDKLKRGETFQIEMTVYTKKIVKATLISRNGIRIGEVQLTGGGTVWVYTSTHKANSYEVVAFEMFNIRDCRSVL